MGLPLGPKEDVESISVTELTSVTGDCVVNNRKGKVIAAYELDVIAKWALKNDASIKGELRLPYVSEENADEDPEIKISLAGGVSGRPAEEARSTVVAARPRVWTKMRVFVDELIKGGPRNPAAGGLGKDSDEPAPKAADDASAASHSEPAAEPAAAAPGTAAAPSSSPASSPSPSTSASAPAQTSTSASSGGAAADGSFVPTKGRTLEFSERFYAGAKELYECFTDERRVSAFTGAPARVEPRPGGQVSLFGGSVTGSFISLSPPEDGRAELVLSWRFSSWADDDVSRVTLTFHEATRGDVKVTLTQQGVPDEDRFGQHDVLNLTRAGWREQIFGRIRRVFGYGV